MIQTAVLILALIGLAAWVAAPLYRTTRPAGAPANDDLDAHNHVLVEALRELEWDHRSGLIDDASYGSQKAELETKAANLRHLLDRR